MTILAVSPAAANARLVHDRDFGPGGEADGAGLARPRRQRVGRHLVAASVMP
jgi:hypothetical protein